MSSQNQKEKPANRDQKSDEIQGPVLFETIVTGLLVGVFLSMMENFTTIFIIMALPATAATLLLRKLGEDRGRPQARVAYSKTTWITSAAGIASVAIKTAEIVFLR